MAQRRGASRRRWVSCVACVVGLALGNENGLARSPPLGWRSWNLFGHAVNQSLMEAVMEGMVARTRLVDGVVTSLCDLGFCDVGLDDNWQICDRTSPYLYHDPESGAPELEISPSGAPIVDTVRFPSLANMTAKAHALGLTAGWYGNNCICPERLTDVEKFYAADVDAVLAYGFDSWKLDGCGAELDVAEFDRLLRLKAPEKPILVENCHWGRVPPAAPTADSCPFNLYRTSNDVEANFGSALANLLSVQAYATANLSYPGCWAYPDMLEVGCSGGPHGSKIDSGLSSAEARTHFGAWAIVSSPLILAMDVRNDTVMDAVWPLISNREVLRVNQQYAGHSGSIFRESARRRRFEWSVGDKPANTAAGARTGSVEVPEQLYLYKPQPEGGVAVLVVNAAATNATLALDVATVPGARCHPGCRVRDLWGRRDLGTLEAFTADLEAHDSALLLLTPAPKADPRTASRGS